MAASTSNKTMESTIIMQRAGQLGGNPMIRQYLSPIAIGFGAALLIVFVSAIPYGIYNFYKQGRVPIRKTLIRYSFIWYLLAAYFLVILPLPSRDAVRLMETPYYNLRPFLFVEHFLRYSGIDFTDPGTYPSALLQPTAYTVYFNLFLMVPLGIYLRNYFKLGFCKTMILGFLLSLFFEGTQLSGLYGIYPRPYRTFNVDDLMINTLGTVLGYFIGFIFRKKNSPRTAKAGETERRSANGEKRVRR